MTITATAPEGEGEGEGGEVSHDIILVEYKAHSSGYLTRGRSFSAKIYKHTVLAEAITSNIINMAI